MAKYTDDNRFEVPDSTPVELPVGCEHPESLEAMIARMIRVEAHKALGEGLESFDEADDFDVEDDGELVSEYQMKDMQEEYYERPISRVERESDNRKSEGDGKKKPEGSESGSQKDIKGNVRETIVPVNRGLDDAQ